MMIVTVLALRTVMIRMMVIKIKVKEGIATLTIQIAQVTSSSTANAAATVSTTAKHADGCSSISAGGDNPDDEERSEFEICIFYVTCH